MANKKTKYIVMLVIFTIIFFFSILVCVIGYRSVSKDYRYSSVSGRVDAIKLDEKMYGPKHIYSTLYFDKDYEDEFDYYWEYANIYRAYVQGRFGDNKQESIDTMQAYVDSCKDKVRKEAVEEYIQIVKDSM